MELTVSAREVNNRDVTLFKSEHLLQPYHHHIVEWKVSTLVVFPFTLSVYKILPFHILSITSNLLSTSPVL